MEIPLELCLELLMAADYLNSKIIRCSHSSLRQHNPQGFHPLQSSSLSISIRFSEHFSQVSTSQLHPLLF